MLNEVEIVSSLIGAGGAILATLIASLAGALIGKRFADQKKLKADLDRAIKDIHFLLKVEARHCELHAQNGGVKHLRNVRKYVKNEQDESWSGRFTPGREGRHVKI